MIPFKLELGWWGPEVPGRSSLWDHTLFCVIPVNIFQVFFFDRSQDSPLPQHLFLTMQNRDFLVYVY